MSDDEDCNCPCPDRDRPCPVHSSDGARMARVRIDPGTLRAYATKGADMTARTAETRADGGPLAKGPSNERYR